MENDEKVIRDAEEVKRIMRENMEHILNQPIERHETPLIDPEYRFEAALRKLQPNLKWNFVVLVLIIAITLARVFI